MDEFIADVKSMTTEYLGYEANALVIQLAIERFVSLRNYPSSYTDEMKLADMEKHKAKIAMAAIEIDSKDGAEGQTGMSENGISRTWTDSIMAYKNVVGFANVL